MPQNMAITGHTKVQFRWGNPAPSRKPYAKVAKALAPKANAKPSRCMRCSSSSTLRKNRTNAMSERAHGGDDRGEGQRISPCGLSIRSEQLYRADQHNCVGNH